MSNPILLQEAVDAIEALLAICKSYDQIYPANEAERTTVELATVTANSIKDYLKISTNKSLTEKEIELAQQVTDNMEFKYRELYINLGYISEQSLKNAMRKIYNKLGISGVGARDRLKMYVNSLSSAIILPEDASN